MECTCVTSYSSVGCNRSPHCADWGHNGLIVYGACHAVAVARAQGPTCVLGTLTGHTDNVNSVQWIRRPCNESENEFISCSTDKCVRVWRKADRLFECCATLQGHTATVNAVAGVYLPSADGLVGTKPDTYLASASADSTLKLWHRTAEHDEFECIQTVSFGTGFIMDLDWIILPNSRAPLLACGGDDQRIHLLAKQDDQFVTVQKLVGHEDWIRGLDFAIDSVSGDVLLASCSQDTFIRVWRISHRDSRHASHTKSIADLQPEEDIKLKENTFSFTCDGIPMCYAITVETVLQGHENWIYSIRWQPVRYGENGKFVQPMCLLSASMDKTMILWEPDPASGVWIAQVRVGEVGGNTLGFYGGLFSPDGCAIQAHGYQGAFHIWHKKDPTHWEPGVTFSGHFAAVEDVAWQPCHGNFLISFSLDQTSRLHGYWQASNPAQSAWHEVARPQVHGYDMQCLAMTGEFGFASGADEKVIRLFEAPRNFIENFGKICGVDTSEALASQSAPEGASVPALGLSNKAVYQGESQNLYMEGTLQPQKNDQYKEAYFSALSLTEPPTEENLLQNTLWPEVQKLYGHGYEIFSLAYHPKGKLLASACKASKVEHAAIIIWDTSTWRQVCSLASHQLTVTQLAFSHQGAYLLSVSRDRTWTVFEYQGGAGDNSDLLFKRIAFSEKKTSAHSRIIWSCAWSHDDKYFITVSRDKKAIIHGQVQDDEATAGTKGKFTIHTTPLELPDSVTAVDFAPVFVCGNQYLLAFGLDRGPIHLYRWNPHPASPNQAWTPCIELNQSLAHHRTVKRLQFCPKTGTPGGQGQMEGATQLQLASCGADHVVKIHLLTCKDSKI